MVQNRRAPMTAPRLVDVARPRAFDEEVVLRAARDAFWSGGFDGTSVDDLTVATRLGKGSLYGAFGDKRALFHRVFERYCHDVTAHLEAAVVGSPDGARDRVAAYVRRAATATADDAARRGCLLAKGSAELAADDAVVADLARVAYERMRAHLTAAIAQAQEAGDITRHVDPGRLAIVVLANLRGLEALGKAGLARRDLLDAAEATIELLDVREASRVREG